MNKRADKPKHKLPITDDSNVTDEQIEQYLRDNHAAVEEMLLEAQRDIENGDVVELGSLEEFLLSMRKPEPK